MIDDPTHNLILQVGVAWIHLDVVEEPILGGGRGDDLGLDSPDILPEAEVLRYYGVVALELGRQPVMEVPGLGEGVPEEGHHPMEVMLRIISAGDDGHEIEVPHTRFIPFSLSRQVA